MGIEYNEYDEKIRQCHIVRGQDDFGISDPTGKFLCFARGTASHSCMMSFALPRRPIFAGGTARAIPNRLSGMLRPVADGSE